MASVEALEELRKELQQTQAAQLERIMLAEKEIVAIKAMEAPNLATIQLLTGTIEARVKAIEGQAHLQMVAVKDDSDKEEIHQDEEEDEDLNFMFMQNKGIKHQDTHQTTGVRDPQAILYLPQQHIVISSDVLCQLYG